MNYFWMSLIVMLVVLAMMSIGVMLGKQPLLGSCGGLGKLMGEDCDFCDDKDKCEHLKKHKAEQKKFLPRHL